MECRWEKSLKPPRRAKPYVPETDPSMQTLTTQMLELAKGFEPPTL
jgi:hypothetical protein